LTSIYVLTVGVQDIAALDHTQWHTLSKNSLRISPSQRPLPDNTQHSQEADIHAPGGIRTRNPSRREAARISLKPRCLWDRLPLNLVSAMTVNLVMPLTHL